MVHGKPFPRKVCPEHTPSGGCTRGAVALGGWRRQEGGGGGSAGTPTGEARSPTGAPGSHRPTGDSFLPSFFPSFLPSSFFLFSGGNPLLPFPGACRGGRQVAARRFWPTPGRRGERVFPLILGKVINKIRLEGRSRA